ncbi:MAG: DnaD domain protein [Clostridia bacterium]|nr:DnaD domain protein [Clostridia bacterium]
MYIANPPTGGFFALPSAAADNFLKLAGAAQLKVLLAVFRNMAAPVDLATIAKMTGLQAGDAADALLFWTERGIITNTDTPSAAAAATAPPQPSPPKEKKKLPEIKPSIAQINKRSAEDPEIRMMLREAQGILGRTIGYDTQAQLLMCCDHLGLPVPVVLLICTYAKSSGRDGLAFIKSMAENWAEAGIVTVEAANARIAVLEETAAVWKRFSAKVGITNPSPTRTQSDYIYKWTVTFGYAEDVLIVAYEEMANHIAKFSMAYMDKAIVTWHDAGLKNAAEIRAYIETRQKEAAEKAAKPKSSKPAGKRDGSAEVSYDIGAAEARAAQGAPVYERKKRK